MDWEGLLARAVAQGASDIHLEPGHPVTLRLGGALTRSGPPLSGEQTRSLAARLLPGAAWQEFQRSKSQDLATVLGRVRCRINVLKSRRGVGLAIRLFPSHQPTLTTLNLLPDLRELTAGRAGLVLVCGPTGSGKSSTLAALLHEINKAEARHVVTIEQPVEFAMRSRQCLIRQREVGRDTPSFERALVDALREDPDVLMVGEMRDPETMRLTLSAAETGHLVFSTLHSATVSEGLDRMVTAFPPEIRDSIAAQLADCLRAVVCQRMTWREDFGIPVPELEILRTSQGARSVIRSGQFYKLSSVLETGARDGQWTFERYRRWLAERTDFHTPAETVAAEPERGDLDWDAEDDVPLPAQDPDERPVAPRGGGPSRLAPAPGDPPAPPDVIVLQPPEESIQDILSELDEDEGG